MTAHEILASVKREIEASLSKLHALRVHDDRVRGQLEALNHIGTVLTNLGAEEDSEPVAAVKAPAPESRQLPWPERRKAAPPRKAARPRTTKRMAR